MGDDWSGSSSLEATKPAPYMEGGLSPLNLPEGAKFRPVAPRRSRRLASTRLGEDAGGGSGDGHPSVITNDGVVSSTLLKIVYAAS